MYSKISEGIASIVVVTMLFAGGFSQAEMLRGSTEWFGEFIGFQIWFRTKCVLRVEVVRKWWLEDLRLLGWDRLARIFRNGDPSHAELDIHNED